MSLIDSIREETCFAGIQGKTDEEVLGILSDKLYEQGIVKEDYKKNVILREKNYPTGLPLVHDKVAIPHTDACYVEETRICVASLKEPVEFGTMGSSSDEKIPFCCSYYYPFTSVQSVSADQYINCNILSVFMKQNFLHVKRTKRTHTIRLVLSTLPHAHIL